MLTIPCPKWDIHYYQNHDIMFIQGVQAIMDISLLSPLWFIVLILKQGYQMVGYNTIEHNSV